MVLIVINKAKAYTAYDLPNCCAEIQSPKSDGSIKVKKLAKERRKSLSPSLNKERSPRKATSGMAGEHSPNFSFKRTSSNVFLTSPTGSAENQVTKPQKEHRKKKKHKKESFGIAAL